MRSPRMSCFATVVRMRRWGRALLVTMGLAIASPASAHPGPRTALHGLDERIAAAPDDVDLRLRRAELRRRMGHPRDALADLRVAVRLAPDERRVELERARIHVALGQPRAAERALDRFLDAGPPHARALAERARLREADGRLEAARADLDAAVATGGTVELYLERGRLDERLGRLDAAAAGYREGLAVLGPAVLLRLALVDVERRRGAHDEALAILDALLAEAPRRADWILQRARILQEAGLPDAAVVERLRALVVADAVVRRRSTPLHRLALAEARLALGQIALAHQQLALVLRDAPQLPAALALQARLAELPEDS